LSTRADQRRERHTRRHANERGVIGSPKEDRAMTERRRVLATTSGAMVAAAAAAIVDAPNVIAQPKVQ
jgi:hypothetical protein